MYICDNERSKPGRIIRNFSSGKKKKIKKITNKKKNKRQVLELCSQVVFYNYIL